jgi:hypothetical protein
MQTSSSLVLSLDYPLNIRGMPITYINKSPLSPALSVTHMTHMRSVDTSSANVSEVRSLWQQKAKNAPPPLPKVNPSRPLSFPPLPYTFIFSSHCELCKVRLWQREWRGMD